MRFLLVLLVIAMTVYTAIDCFRTPDHEMRYLPKPVWLLVILVVWVVGPLLWLLTGRVRGQSGPVAPPRPIAPDDDPEFLRRIAQQRRLAEREAELTRREEELRRREAAAGDPDDERPQPRGEQARRDQDSDPA